MLRRRSVRGDGVHRGRDAAQVDGARRAAPVAGGDRGVRASRARAGGGPPRRAGAPRLQAGERDDRRARAACACSTSVWRALRDRAAVVADRPDPARGRPGAADVDDRRDAALHGAGAAPRAAVRRPLGPVQLLRGVLRGAVRACGRSPTATRRSRFQAVMACELRTAAAAGQGAEVRARGAGPRRWRRCRATATSRWTRCCTRSPRRPAAPAPIGGRARWCCCWRSWAAWRSRCGARPAASAREPRGPRSRALWAERRESAARGDHRRRRALRRRDLADPGGGDGRPAPSAGASCTPAPARPTRVGGAGAAAGAGRAHDLSQRTGARDLAAMLTALAEEPDSAARHAVEGRGPARPGRGRASMSPALPAWLRARPTSTGRCAARRSAAGWPRSRRPTRSAATSRRWRAPRWCWRPRASSATRRWWPRRCCGSATSQRSLADHERAAATLGDAYFMALGTGADRGRRRGRQRAADGRRLPPQRPRRRGAGGAQRARRCCCACADRPRIAAAFYNNRAVVRAAEGRHDEAGRGLRPRAGDLRGRG